MRAREFTINIPINIKINGDGEPEIDITPPDPVDPSELDQAPIMVPPLQQHIEMTKAQMGKESPIIAKLTQIEAHPDDFEEEEEEDEEEDNSYPFAG